MLFAYHSLKVTVKSVLPGYTLPAPPEVCIDDIRPPIPWYQNENDDDFDWSDIETQSTSTAEIKDAPQYYGRTVCLDLILCFY